MDYQKMWEELKRKIEKDAEYHKSGVMQSMTESLQGEEKCKEILTLMAQIEETGGKKE